MNGVEGRFSVQRKRPPGERPLSGRFREESSASSTVSRLGKRSALIQSISQSKSSAISKIRTDAGNRHQAPAYLIVAYNGQQTVMQNSNLLT
jgi:hypothetical protein